ncbi:hypothetical protein BDR05DRAFT_365423 [Suillus weaverae]|nr:hypothetical protein BDR05DRAFT_365423 [Suillus weaverae]
MHAGLTPPRSSSCDTAHGSSNEVDHMYTPASLPPIVQHLPLYVNRARRRFKPYERDGPTMWTLRFAEDYITPGKTDMNIRDVQSGKDLLRRGLKHLPREAIAQAVLTKEADLEWRRLSALATAWRIEASERHNKFLQMILECEAETYASADSETLEASLQALVDSSPEELQDHTDFGVAAYNNDVTSFAVADQQLDDMESIAQELYVFAEDEDVAFTNEQLEDVGMP